MLCFISPPRTRLLMSVFFFSSRRRHTRWNCDWSSDVCSSDLNNPHLLIGGLGMGFTLRAALAVLGSDARIVVAELVPAVIGWARGPMADIFGDSLDDPRASIREADVV